MSHLSPTNGNSNESPIDKVEKLIIIGSGPAGLTSALYAARARLNPLVFEGEEAGGQLMLTTEVENYPGFVEGITGPDLISILRQQAQRFGTRLVKENVTKIDFKRKPFTVHVGKENYSCHALILSTGASANWLGLSSEEKYRNRGVSACATCDGAFFQGVEVGVVGGGDTAMEEAQFLTRFAKKVFVIHRRDQFRASKIMVERTLKNPKIEVLWNCEVKEVKGNEKAMTSVSIYNNKQDKTFDLPLEGLFIAIGHKPNTELFKEAIELDEKGYIQTQANSTYTNIKGVFAAGDVQDTIYRQAVTAAGTGCMAAIDCERWLERQGL